MKWLLIIFSKREHVRHDWKGIFIIFISAVTHIIIHFTSIESELVSSDIVDDIIFL